MSPVSSLVNVFLRAFRRFSLRPLRLRAFCVAIAIAITIGVALSASAQQKTILLKGGQLLTVSHGVIENGLILIDNGKIAEVWESPDDIDAYLDFWSKS